MATSTHCFQGARSRDAVSLVDGVVPRRFPMNEKGMDVRLCNPGVDWGELGSLTEKYTQKFDDSLHEYLTKCFAKKNLRLSRSSIGGRPQQFTLSSIATPGLSKHTSRVNRNQKRPKLAVIISDSEEEFQEQSTATNQRVEQSIDLSTSPAPVNRQFYRNSPESPECGVDHPCTLTKQHHSDHYSPIAPVEQQVDCNSPVLVEQDESSPILEQRIGHNSPPVAPAKQQVNPNSSPILAEQQNDCNSSPMLTEQLDDHNSPAQAEQQDDHNSPAQAEQQDDHNSPAQAEQQDDCYTPALGKQQDDCYTPAAPGEQQVDRNSTVSTEHVDCINPALAEHDHNSPASVKQHIGYDSPTIPVKQNSDPTLSDGLVSSKAPVEDTVVDQLTEDEAKATEHSDLDSAAVQTDDTDSFHTPRGSSGEENDTAKNDQEAQKSKLRLQRLENLFGTKGSENRPKYQPMLKVTKSFLPRNSPRRPETHEEKNKQLQEKMAKKKADEELRQKELALRKEQERLERIKKREEKMKRVQEKQAQIQKAEEQKKEKIAGLRTKQQQLKEKLLQEQQKKKEQRNQRQRERMLAAESRRKQEEEHKKQKILKAEEEKRMVEEVHRKRMEAEDERKRVEAAEREKQRLREREAQEREREAEMKKKKEQQTTQKEDPPKKVLPADSVDKLLLHWKQQLDQRKAAKDVTAIPRIPPISSSTKPALDATFIKPGPSVVSSPQLNKHQKYARIDSYELTPANPLEEAENNYNISDLSSDDSTDDESCPKKKVPKWAAPTSVSRVMSDQESHVKQHPEIADFIFPPEELLLDPDLSSMFKKKRKRFDVRSSSAHWTSPLIKKSRSN